MQLITAPTLENWGSKRSVFLAGSIDNGDAVDWQTSMAQALENLDVVVLNPRRKNWLGGSEPRLTNPIFEEQVSWELNHLELADLIFVYFKKGSQSPISLLELGLCAGNKDMVVCCEPGFWRRGNVEAICSHFDIPLFDELSSAVRRIKRKLRC